MKSLVEEASSVVKAIEKAWNRAGCPQTFSVKVFETPETNFFGFTKKSAKVGIFFEEEVAPQQKKYGSQNREQRPNNRSLQRGRDENAYARENGSSDDLVQVESRRAHHTGRQPQQGQRTSEQRSSEPRQNTTNQRQQPSAQEDRQERQPRERQQRPNNRPARPQDRERAEQPRQARMEAQIPFVEETHYEPREQEAPRQEREFEPRREREQEQRSQERPEPRREPRHENRREEYEQPEMREPRGEREEGRREHTGRDRDRRGRDDRRSSRGGDRDRGGRNGRPQRAQRHEFDEQRPLFNETSEPSQSAPDHQAPTSCPEVTTIPSLLPQKKVLKVSGRRYSAPVKKTDE